jgi:hypothetical protein
VIFKPEQDSGNILQINGADTTSEILEVGITSGHAQFTATNASGGSNACGFIFRTRHTSGGTTEKLRIETSGKILHSSSSGDNQFTSRRTNVAGSSGDYFFHLNAQNRTPQTVGGLGFHQDGAEDSSRFVVLTRKTGGSNVARLNVMSGGDVRINVDGSGNESSERGVLRFYRTGYSDDMLDSRIVFDSSIGTNSTNDGTYAASIAGRRSGDDNGSSELSFYTCNSSNSFAEQERLRITSSGKIGINVTNPDLTLHVNGVNALPSSSGSTATGHLTLRAKASSSSHGMFMGVSNAAPWGSWIQAQDASNNATNYPLLLNPNGGNVGIGAENPQATLQVGAGYNSNNGTLLISADNSLHNYIRFTNGGATETHYPSGIWYQPSGRMELRAALNASSSNAAQLVLASNGNVGVGIATPTGNFEVNGNDGVNISNASRTGTNGAQWRLIPNSGGSNTNAATNLRLYEGAGGVEVLNIQKDGQVMLGHNELISHPNMDDLQIGDANGNRGLTICSGTGAFGSVCFGDSADGSGNDRYEGFVEYYHGEDSLRFGTTHTEKFRLKSTADGGSAHFKGDVYFGTASGASDIDTGRLQCIASSSTYYGNTIEHATHVVMTNEQGSTCQAMTLGDTGSGTNTSVLWAVSILNNTGDPTTGVESGWAQKARVEGNGDFVIAGSYTPSGSDDRLKKNKITIPNALSKVQAMEGFTFEWNDIADKIGMSDGDKHLGLSAQTVEALVPEVVVINDTLKNPDDGTNDYKTIRYEKLVPLLVEAIKEQQGIIDQLKQRLDDAGL